MTPMVQGQPAQYYGTYWFHELVRFLTPVERRTYWLGQGLTTFKTRLRGVHPVPVWYK